VSAFGGKAEMAPELLFERGLLGNRSFCFGTGG
jgi:hypothetical protein